MSESVEVLKNRIRILEEENFRLKQLLDEAGISYYKKTDFDENDISVDKCRLFFSYFWGRTDVYANRYVNKKTGTSGYYPQCSNLWRYGVCPKAEKIKIQCKDCDNKCWTKLGSKQIKAHLKGEKADCSDVIGVYPLFQDGTCRFIAFDFDNHNAGNDDLGFDKDDVSWIDEVNTLRKICKNFDIPALVERSRSGSGAHVWIFFDKAIPAATARRFGFVLLDKGAEIVNLKSFRFYDRMMPAQDELKNGGLGNLIALPLQGRALQNGNSAFVDEKWNAYHDQWKALTDTGKLTEERIEEFLKEYSELESETESAEDDKPWERKKHFNKNDVDGKLEITLSNCIYIKKTNLKPRIQNQLRRMAAVSNPSYFKNNAMGLSNFNNPRFIYMGHDDSDYICVPRGVIDEIEQNAQDTGIETLISDERCKGRDIKVDFVGELREEQARAIDSLESYDNGIISAATAFGKTVVCSNLIAKRGVSTLILLESTALIEQWQDTFDHFLEIDEELPEYSTPTGMIKKRKSHVGIIHGAKDTSTGIIDIAMVGSLKKKGEFHERLQSYGMVIVDECHHSASDTMREILMHVNSQYIYGVTATPFRGDGLQKINNMLLGPIRFQYTAKERAKSQTIDYRVVPRFTRVVNPHGLEKHHINDDYEVLKNSSVRNSQICDDIRKCVADGRTPIVLSKYKEHAEFIYSEVRDAADNVFLLTGSLSKKQQQAIRQEMNDVTDNQSMILVATGKLVGEGFDFPRLDTLILATPVAFKGVVEQYAGRLNRDYPGKEKVLIYDYIDSNIPVFDNMYAKRLKTYKRIGYSLQVNDNLQKQDADLIFDYESYESVYNKDLANSNKSIVISSPSLSFMAVNDLIRDVKPLQERGVKITVVTWNQQMSKATYAAKRLEMLKMLQNAGIEVFLKNGCCQRYAVIDNSIVWYGSMNLLGKRDIDDSIMRIDNDEVAAEVLELGFKNKG